MFVALTATLLLPRWTGAQPPDRPNVVIILVDDMGWSDIGSYGSEISTPHLDALAANGLRFTQFYNTARCSPSRASRLTGLYPHQAGMGHLDNVVVAGSLGTTGRLNDQSVTIAEVLRDAGYFTAMSGKWHLGQQNGSPPWQRGFDRVLNIRAGGIFFPNQKFEGSDELTRRGQEPRYLDGAPIAHDSPQLGQHWYTTYLWTDFALKFVDDARAAGRPFFLYIPHNAPHFPLMAPADLIAKYRGEYRAGWDSLRAERYRRQVASGLIDRRWPLSPRESESPAWSSLSSEAQDRFDHLMAVYAAMIEAIDISVGRLVAGLEARKVLDNTLIVFLSDNGGSAESGPDGRFNGTPPGGPNANLYLGMNGAALTNTPFRRFKHFIHEGGVATLLIAHWPRGIRRRNELDHQPGHLVDIMPTILDVTGSPLPARVPGPGESASDVHRSPHRPKAADLLGTRGQSRDPLGPVEARLASSGRVGALRHNADRVESKDVAAGHRALVRRLASQWDAWAKRACGSVARASADQLGRRDCGNREIRAEEESP